MVTGRAKTRPLWARPPIGRAGVGRARPKFSSGRAPRNSPRIRRAPKNSPNLGRTQCSPQHIFSFQKWLIWSGRTSMKPATCNGRVVGNSILSLKRRFQEAQLDKSSKRIKLLSNTNLTHENTLRYCKTLQNTLFAGQRVFGRAPEILGARPSFGRARYVWAGGRRAGAPENFWARLGSDWRHLKGVWFQVDFSEKPLIYLV